jgi:N-acetylglutamate synthase-like GNAT family acetyltransferase
MSEHPVSVRPARPADLAAIAEVFRSASLHNERDRPLLSAHPELLELEADLLQRRRVMVAERDGRVVGFAGTEPADGSTWELEDLFVAPAEMRQGVARALIADVVSGARAAGATAITVAANEHALGFYSSVGFVVVGTATLQFGTTPRMRLDIGTDDVPPQT